MLAEELGVLYAAQRRSEQAARTPDAVAAVFEEEKLSYRELNRRANQVTHHLRVLGVSAGNLAQLVAKLADYEVKETAGKQRESEA